MSAAPAVQTDEQLVVFRLDNESYGIEIFRVHEIIRLREITPIPRTGEHIRGLVNLRGKTIPVVDLHARFELEPTEDTDATRIIVVETEQGNVGVVVDEVKEVITLDPEQIEQTPVLVASVSTEFVRGVAKQSGMLITLLDLDKALVSL
jgi:purine-binding chemotaxis protein CheW